MRASWRNPVGHLTCALLFSCALVSTLVGCADSTAGGRAAASSTVPRGHSPVELCTRLVSHWARESLRGSRWSGLDWEQKGLSTEQYALHEEVLAEARAEERRRGRRAALALIDREVRERCTAGAGATRGAENRRPPRTHPALPTPARHHST